MGTFQQRPPTIEDPFYEKIFVGEILEARAAVKEKTTQINFRYSKLTLESVKRPLTTKVQKLRILQEKNFKVFKNFITIYSSYLLIFEQK